MACPICDHTMQNVATNLWWCPRCGSIQGDHEAATMPKLVQRCREFERTALSVDDDPVGVEEWEQLGIAESIYPPADRLERRQDVTR